MVDITNYLTRRRSALLERAEAHEKKFPEFGMRLMDPADVNIRATNAPTARALIAEIDAVLKIIKE